MGPWIYSYAIASNPACNALCRILSTCILFTRRSTKLQTIGIVAGPLCLADLFRREKVLPCRHSRTTTLLRVKIGNRYASDLSWISYLDEIDIFCGYERWSRDELQGVGICGVLCGIAQLLLSQGALVWKEMECGATERWLSLLVRIPAIYQHSPVDSKTTANASDCRHRKPRLAVLY